MVIHDLALLPSVAEQLEKGGEGKKMKSLIILALFAFVSAQDYHLQDDYYDHYDDANYLEPDYFAQREYEAHASPGKDILIS